MCVCERERERERESACVCIGEVCVIICTVYVRVCAQMSMCDVSTR